MKTSRELRRMDALEREGTEVTRLMRLPIRERFMSAVELDNLKVADHVGPDCPFAGAATNFLLLIVSIPR